MQLVTQGSGSGRELSHHVHERVPPLHRRLFGRERGLAWRVVAAPLALVSKVVLTTLLPLVLVHLDFLDEKRTMTTGHEAVARKPRTGGAP